MTLTDNTPKWATFARQEYLVQLFLSSGGFCVFGHKLCQFAKHHYPVYIESLIKAWQQDDREQAADDWDRERKAIHCLGEQSYPITGRFNAISKDIFASNQPLYYLEGRAVSGLTLKPFVRVRLSSSYLRLYVDLSDALRQVSKSKRRKATRYGKAFPREIESKIRLTILRAVRDYLAY